MEHYGELCQKGLTDQHAVLEVDSGGPKEPCIRYGCRSSKAKGRRGNFLGLSGPFKSIGNLRCSGRCSIAAEFAAKGIIQSPIMSCSRRDHSVCQAGANSILKMFGRTRFGLSAAKGAAGLDSAGEV